MPVTATEFDDFFERYGWRFERRSSGLFRTGFQGDTGQYEIWVRVTEPWVYFTINPFVDRTEDREHGDEVLLLLLRLNHELNMAKFGLDKDGDVALSVEIPTEGFHYSHFADALTALSHYADAYRDRFEEALASDGQEVV